MKVSHKKRIVLEEDKRILMRCRVVVCEIIIETLYIYKMLLIFSVRVCFLPISKLKFSILIH